MTPRGAVERCHRCLQPVPASARRCPHCGDRLKANFRQASLYIGIALTIGILAIVAFSLYITPMIVDRENLPESERKQEPATPPKPVKKPPLN
jgi:hypothetical protein